MPKTEIDQSLMTELKEHAQQLKAQHAQRDGMFEQYDEMYLLNWKKKADKKLEWMQVTASPSFRNAIQGAVRLMVATDPLINVVQNERSKGVNTEKVESFLSSVLHYSGRVAGEPVHYPLMTTGILYDEMHAAITSTADMLEFARKADTRSEAGKLYKKANIARWEEINDASAFLVEPFNPKNGYPEFGPTGLTAYYRVAQTTLGKVADQFGQLPEGLADAARSTPVTLHTFYDQVYTAIWLDQGDLFLRPHGLPRIPVVVSILNGSRIFANAEDQRQPMGYAVLKANLFNAQSLALTVIYTAVLNMGATPTKVYTPAVDGSQIDIDNSSDLINLHPGDRLDFVQSKGLIDPALMTAYQLAETKGQESTIYPQALGQAVERQGATYSELALLTQSGRLPLIGPQKRGGWAFSDIFETILSFMRADSRYRRGTGLLTSDFPKGIEIETKLDVALPQDKLQQANIVQLLTEGDNPKVSVDWALDKILNVTNPQEMRRQIWNEQAERAMFMKTLQMLMSQPSMTPVPKGGSGTFPPGAQPGMPGSEGLPPGAQPGPVGAPMQGGLPQAQAGLVPGPGQQPMTPGQMGQGGML